jgi:hypothetical protein
MSGEPDFELYDKTRNEMPDSVEEMWDQRDDFLADIEPDTVVTGYNALKEYLDESAEEEVVEGSNGEEMVIQGELQFWWREVDSESAPEKEICSTCGETKRTRSEERLAEIRHMHHVSTGH